MLIWLAQSTAGTMILYLKPFSSVDHFRAFRQRQRYDTLKKRCFPSSVACTVGPEVNELHGQWKLVVHIKSYCTS